MSEIQKSVQLLAETLASKNQDYTGGRGEFYNFEQSAEFASVGTLDAMLIQIGIKLTRIRGLNGMGMVTNFESFKDSFLDLAGYAIIAHAYLSAEEDAPVRCPSRDNPEVWCDHSACGI